MKSLSPKARFSLVLTSVFLVGLLLGAIYVQATAPSGTFFISQGVYPGAPSYTVWREGSTYFAKDANGQIDFSGTNASKVIYDVINVGLLQGDAMVMGNDIITAPYGTIYFTEGQFILSKMISIPLGSRIKITGSGFTSQPITYVDLRGGTQLISDDGDGAFTANDWGTLKNGTYVVATPGTTLYLEGLEFYQRATLNAVDEDCIYLNGMSQGELRDIYISSRKNIDTRMVGTGIKAVTYAWSDRIIWTNVQVYGFEMGGYVEVDHFRAVGCGFGASQRALRVGMNSHVSWIDTHIFSSYTILDTAPYPISFYTFPNIIFEGMLIESVGTTTHPLATWSDSISNDTATGKIIINKVYVCGGGANTWNFTRKERYEFHNVITGVTGDLYAPPFPTAITPSVSASGVALRNPNPNMVDVYVAGGTVSNIAINGVNTNLGGGRFTLFGRDTITLTYSAAPAWVWRNYEVTHPN